MDGNGTKKREFKEFVKNKAKYALRFWYIYVAVILVAALVVSVAVVRGFSKGDGSGKTPTGSVTETGVAPEMKITFIDVGQGDCIFVEFPDGKTMLVDSGNKGSEREIDKYLADGGVKRKIDYCVATHSDADHTGSMAYVYENYEVGYSLRPYEKCGIGDLAETFNAGADTGCETEDYLAYLTAVEKENTGWSFFTDNSDFENAALFGGVKYGYSVDFLMPYAKKLGDYGKFAEPNDFSAVIMITFAGRKILLTGDIGEKAENAFLSHFGNNGECDCDVLKVAHHGSGSSSQSAFLSAVKPEYAVISCSPIGSDYGHPHKEALERITAEIVKGGENSGLFRTDIHGSVFLTVKSDGEMIFKTEYDELNGYLFYDGREIKEKEDEIKTLKGLL